MVLAIPAREAMEELDQYFKKMVPMGVTVKVPWVTATMGLKMKEPGADVMVATEGDGLETMRRSNGNRLDEMETVLGNRSRATAEMATVMERMKETALTPTEARMVEKIMAVLRRGGRAEAMIGEMEADLKALAAREMEAEITRFMLVEAQWGRIPGQMARLACWTRTKRKL